MVKTPKAEESPAENSTNKRKSMTTKFSPRLTRNKRKSMMAVGAGDTLVVNSPVNKRKSMIEGATHKKEGKGTPAKTAKASFEVTKVNTPSPSKKNKQAHSKPLNGTPTLSKKDQTPIKPRTPEMAPGAIDIAVNTPGSAKKNKRGNNETPVSIKKLKKMNTPTKTPTPKKMLSNDESGIASDEDSGILKTLSNKKKKASPKGTPISNKKKQAMGQPLTESDDDFDVKTPTIKKGKRNVETPANTPSKKQKKADQSTSNSVDSEMANNEGTSNKKNKKVGNKKQKNDLGSKSNNNAEVDDDKVIFVGNLPKEITKKELLKIFSEFGKIQAVRFRSAPIADSRTPKKVAVIKKDFHPDRTNINAYIRFTTAASAKAALVCNNKVIGERHIRVAPAKNTPIAYNKAIFIGNLQFASDEEDLRKVFESCGEIVSVRIIRDKRSGLGKGFAYINFSTTGAVELALLKNGVFLNGRDLRVQRSLKGNMKARPRKKTVAKPSNDGATQVKQRKPAVRKFEKSKSGANSFAGEQVSDKNAGKIKKKDRKKRLNKKKFDAVQKLAKTIAKSAKKQKKAK